MAVQAARQDANPRFACALDTPLYYKATLIKRLTIDTAPSNENQSRPGTFGDPFAATGELPRLRYDQPNTSTFSTSAQA
jgi:hypothetical protein